MWSVVHFYADNCVEVVPTSWIEDGELCAWPKNNYHAAKLRDGKVKPNKCEFDYYRARVLSSNISSLLEAKEKLGRAQFTSDISDLDDNTNLQNPKNIDSNVHLAQSSSKMSGKPMRLYPKHNLDIGVKSKKKGSAINSNEPSTTESNEAIDESIDDDYSPEQKKQKVSTNNIFDNIDDGCYYGIYDSLLASDNISPREVNKSMDFVDIGDTSGKFGVSVHKNNVINMNLNEPANSTCVINSAKTPQPSPLNNNVNSKTLLNYLAYIKVEVMKISDVQQQILEQLANIDAQRQNTNLNMISAEEIDYFVTTWPISTQNKLDDLEYRLQYEDNFKNKVVNELIRVGGKTLKDMIYKIMRKVLDDTLLKEYTYFGLRNKNNFSILILNKTIFDAIRKSKFKKSTDDEKIAVIRKWLTTSKSRLEKKSANS